MLVSQYLNEVNFMVNKGCEEYSFWVLMLILKETSNYDRGCKVHSSIPLLPCPKFMKPVLTLSIPRCTYEFSIS